MGIFLWGQHPSLENMEKKKCQIGADATRHSKSGLRYRRQHQQSPNPQKHHDKGPIGITVTTNTITFAHSCMCPACRPCIILIVKNHSGPLRDDLCGSLPNENSPVVLYKRHWCWQILASHPPGVPPRSEQLVVLVPSSVRFHSYSSTAS